MQATRIAYQEAPPEGYDYLRTRGVRHYRTLHYHSKYNAIGRCWGILETHWNGSLLDSVEAVVAFTRSMTWKGAHPVVEVVTTRYQTGVTLTKEAMAEVEAQLLRLPTLGKWFVDIPYTPCLPWHT